MGFFRQQEENLAIRLLKWQYQRMKRVLPGDTAMKQHAHRIVDDAHRIAKEKGRSVITIIKEMVDDLRRK
ncbi:MAG: hypothetical protein V3S89_12215 [Desulfobacterales bacterium]